MFDCKKRPFLLLFAFCCTLLVKAQISIHPNADPATLARIMTGYGVQVFNASFTGGKFAAGSFQNSGNNLLLDSGIVLTNGFAKSQAPGIGADGFSTQTASNDLSLPGDATLEGLINNLARTHDAAVLEFDFIPAGDTVDFKFVFGSEEYPQYNCTAFSDLFGFIIGGPGYPRGKNIALVPGTDVPVAINSINNGTPGPGGNISYCQLLGPGSPFRGYYVDNSNAAIVYNGMTKTLTAGAHVTPCSTYHLKLAIADLSDGLFDSGVFIKASSFNSTYARFEYTGNRDVNNRPFLVEGCNNGSLLKVLYSKKVQTPTEVRLTFAGTADNNTDLVNPLPVFVDFPLNDSVLSFPLSAIQDNIPEGLETLKIYVAPLICGNGFNTDSIEIDIKDFWPLTIQPAAPTVCPGGNIQFSVVEPGLNNFNWSPRYYLNSFTVSNPICTPADTITYTAVAEYSPGCRAQGNVFVALKDSASIRVTKKDIGCINNSGQIIVSPGGSWLQPQFSINGSPYIPDSVFNNLTAGTYIITVQDAGGCTARTTVTLVQLPALRLQASVIASANCNGQDGQIKITGNGGVPPYAFSTDGINYQPGNIFTVPAGNYTVYVKDNIDCSVSQAISVTPDPPITLVIGLTADSCRGLPDGSITIQASGGTGVYTYSLDGAPGQAANVFNVVAGNHSITTEDDRGCRHAQTVTVPLVNNLTVNAGNDTTICEGSSFAVRASSNASIFNWTPASGLNDPTLLNPVASPVMATTYTLQASSGLCSVQDDILVDIIASPVANAGPDAVVCKDQQAFLHGEANGLMTWHPVNLFSNPSLPDQTVWPAVTTTYWLEAVNEFGCVSLLPDSVRVTVLPDIHAFAGNDTVVAFGQPLQLVAGGNGNTYYWSPSTGLDDPFSATPVAILYSDMTYSLRVTNAAGCTDYDSIHIKAYQGPEIYVPSAFTPDHNGRNDLLRAIPAGLKTFNYFKIFNRWGQLVFSTNNASVGWDGKINNIAAPTGTFVWIAAGIDYSGKSIFRKGTVTLIR
ncbi:MAG: T9SS type B sorting domain-containing protein [Terrimonas sp.]|nr:T9SS type B sorting domain-containing protein [Terrimonas sp.]